MGGMPNTVYRRNTASDVELPGRRASLAAPGVAYSTSVETTDGEQTAQALLSALGITSSVVGVAADIARREDSLAKQKQREAEHLAQVSRGFGVQLGEEEFPTLEAELKQGKKLFE